MERGRAFGSFPPPSLARAPMRRKSLVTNRGIVRKKALFMKAVYSRFFEVDSIDASTFTVAQDWLKMQEDAGEIWAIGIYDEETKILHVSDGRPETFGGDEDFNRLIADCKEKGIEVLRIEFYAANVGQN